MEKEIVVRSRGIIFHNDKLLVVKHGKDFDYYALPGGHVEWEENPKECVAREILEELGVVPKVGKLLYVYSFANSEHRHFVEFLFEITNGEDYLDIEKLKKGTHGHELFEICWTEKGDEKNILPEVVNKDFLSGNLLSDNVRFIKKIYGKETLV